MRPSILLISLFSASSAFAATMKYTFDFSLPTANCYAGFSDFPVNPDMAQGYELESAIEQIPGARRTGFKIHGFNHSDDLFMYVKCYVLSDLEPSTKYHGSVVVRLSTDAPKGCSGAGGSPDSLTLKAGVVTDEPVSIAGDEPWPYTNYTINYDKGAQTNGGKDLVVISEKLDNGKKCEDKNATLFYSVQRAMPKPVEFSTDSSSGFWVILGTDSGFEGASTLYYDKIELDVQ